MNHLTLFATGKAVHRSSLLTGFFTMEYYCKFYEIFWNSIRENDMFNLREVIYFSETLLMILHCWWTYIFAFASAEAASQRSFVKGCSKKLAKFTDKCLWRSLIFNNVASLRPATLLKRDYNAAVFLWNLRSF